MKTKHLLLIPLLANASEGSTTFAFNNNDNWIIGKKHKEK